MIGEVVGSFRLLKLLGEGGMGAVYLAEHHMLGRRAAVKVLRAECSANQDVVHRFFNEARALSLLRHPGLVDVYDFGHRADGTAFIVMEYLAGTPLGRYVADARQVPVSIAIDLGRQMASALAIAHERGIIHRDLKPDNVLLVADEATAFGLRAKLLDFGIAKLDASQRSGSVTRTGIVMGTPLYMSPEQCRSLAGTDQRSDVYSLGCVLYEMLAGRPPFQADNAAELIAAHLREEPPPLASLVPTVAPSLDHLLARMLAKEPAQRPASMLEVVHLLGQTGRRPVAVPLPTPPAGVRRVGDNTTLRASARELPSSTATVRTGRRVAIGAGTAAALAIAMIAAFAVGRRGADERPAAAAAVAPARPTVHTLSDLPPVSPATVAPVAPKRWPLEIVTTPAGVAVVDAASGTVKGRTPYHGWVEGSAPYTLLLQLPAHREQRVTIEPGRGFHADIAMVRTPPKVLPKATPRRRGPTKINAADELADPELAP